MVFMPSFKDSNIPIELKLPYSSTWRRQIAGISQSSKALHVFLVGAVPE